MTTTIIPARTVDRTSYRLTPDDEARIAHAIDSAVGQWRFHRRDLADPGRPFTTTDLATLERLAHHSIGCSHHDLRDIELDYITGLCTTALGLTPTNKENPAS